MNKIVFALLLIAAALFNSCKDNGVGPKPEDKPGRRDYVWTVDTINVYNIIGKIWGSSPNDIWAITEFDYSKNIWHYDGSKWTTDDVFRFVSPHALWGYSQNKVFIGGQGGKIWFYNGSNWSQVAELKKEGTEYIAFENIWGENYKDLFAVGSGPDDKGYFNKSVISHYYDGKWNMLNTDALKGDVVHLYKNLPDQKIYFRLTKIGGIEHVDSTIIYEYKQDKYYPIYSGVETKGLQGDISYINGEVYFILGNEIAKRSNDKFQTILKMEDPNFYQRIWGRNSKDIFLLMTDGLAHYNGTDVEYLFNFTHADAVQWTQIFDAALFNNDIFFTVFEPTTNLNLIYHGKLKE